MVTSTSKYRKIVEQACKKETNYFGYGIWTHHITSVIKYAKLLAKKLKADEEVVEIAAIFHDYASVVDKKLYLEHHLHSARLAEEILKQDKYSQDKINQIKYCIRVHRIGYTGPRKTLESNILASADSMAHFDHVDSLLYLAYTAHRMGIGEGKKWVLAKLQRGWKKMLPEAKAIIENKRQAIKIVFN